MKLRQIIIASVILVILGLIYIPILKKEVKEKPIKSLEKIVYVPVITAKNKIRTEKLEAYGQITPNLQLDVIFEVQGRLKAGNKTLKPGVNFKKGEILYSVDRIEQLYSIFSRRTAFASLITSILPDLKIDFPIEFKKWETFSLAINETHNIPQIPAFKTEKEKRFISSKNILSEYYGIKSQEARLDKYYFIAPFSGSVLNIYSEPGAMVSPGARVATIVKTNDYEVAVPIQKDNIETFKNSKNIYFTNPEGTAIGEGKLKRISEFLNQSTQSVNAYFSIALNKGFKIYQGDFVNLITEADVVRETVALPMTAVQKNKIQYLKDNKIMSQTVFTSAKNEDSVYVSGLNDNIKVLLSPIENSIDSLIYQGIEK
ncbi:MAG: efflux RND transporter periplasmic adaptor subunit [Lishizhenia sp.]